MTPRAASGAVTSLGSDAKPLVVGRPTAPDRDRLFPLLESVLASEHLTNAGPLHQRLEAEVAAQIRCPTVLTSSGTAALMMALRGGDLAAGGEVITTPLSFAATAQAIDWSGFRPVFADIGDDGATLDPAAVEEAITDRTVAIVAVHFLGILCDVQALADVARRHDLWLVYDAAHAFDLALGPAQAASHGDVSAFSFHATKVFHTIEGGAVVTHRQGLAERFAGMRNFSMVDGRPVAPGFNAKMSEFHAATGLVLLERFADELSQRRRIRDAYDELLAGHPVRSVGQPFAARRGLGYYPVRIAASAREAVAVALRRADVFPRSSFPLLCGPRTRFPGRGDDRLARAGAASRELLALPCDGRMTEGDVERVVAILDRALRRP